MTHFKRPCFLVEDIKTKSPLLRLLPILVLNIIELGIALPVLPALVYAAGGDGFDVGAMYTVQALGQFIMAPIWGDLSDRFGRKPVLLATFLLAGVFEIATAFASGLALIFAVRFVVGLCAGNIATASALITDVTSDKDRSKGMAIVGISFGLGFTIGPAIGALVTSFSGAELGPMGVGAPFIVAGLLSFATFFAGLVILFEPMTSAQRAESRLGKRLSIEVIRTYFSRPAFAAMAFVFFAYTVSTSILEATFFIFVADRFEFGPEEVGYAFAGLGLLMATVQGSVGRVAKKFNDSSMALAGGLTVTLGLGLAPFAPSAALFMFCAAISTVGRAYLHPALLSAASKRAERPSETGRVMGLVQSSGTLGRIAGPILGGYLFTQIMPGAPFWAAAGVMGLAIVVWFGVYRRLGLK